MDSPQEPIIGLIIAMPRAELEVAGQLPTNDKLIGEMQILLRSRLGKDHFGRPGSLGNMEILGTDHPNKIFYRFPEAHIDNGCVKVKGEKLCEIDALRFAVSHKKGWLFGDRPLPQHVKVPTFLKPPSIAPQPFSGKEKKDTVSSVPAESVRQQNKNRQVNK